MMNPITEMRRLSNRSFEELKRLAVATCGLLPDTKCSKVELITYIVTQECMHDHIAERIAHPEMNTERNGYVLEEIDDSIHYVMLTTEQIDFMRWCENKGVNFSGIVINKWHDFEWEKP